MMKSLKRMRSEEEEEEEEYSSSSSVGIADIAKCLMLLSRNNQYAIEARPISAYRPPPPSTFECKTCNRRFSSFQALGGHRASHKKPRLGTNAEEHHHDDRDKTTAAPAPANKRHECSICGVVFSMGQALGGHMRRHRALMEGAAVPVSKVAASHPVVVLRRSNSFLKVSAATSWLDLNLTPLENDLKLLFGNMPPKVDPFIS